MKIRILATILLAAVLLSLAFIPLNAIAVTINTAAIAADTNFAGRDWAGGVQYADLFYQIDQGTVNTTSIELEISGDGTNWYDDPISPTLLSANAADASGVIVNIPIHGAQFRIVANATNTNTITPVLVLIQR